MSMAGLALAWLLADERVTQVVIGPGRPEHLAPVGEALGTRSPRRSGPSGKGGRLMRCSSSATATCWRR